MTLGHALHIAAAAAAASAIGAVWYSPLLFTNAWVRAHGYTPEQVTELRAKAFRTYAGSFVAFLLIAWALHLLLAHLGMNSVHGGVEWAFHVWLGFAAPITLIAWLYSNKPIAAFLIDAGYQLVFLLTMGAILGALL